MNRMSTNGGAVGVPIGVPALLKCSSEQFSESVARMSPTELMETISGLQREMTREQENFNSLGQQLEGVRDKRSRQYKQISADLMDSQARLTLLMDRSMKCFSQQPGKAQTLDRKKLPAGEGSGKFQAMKPSRSAQPVTPESPTKADSRTVRSASFTSQARIQPQTNQNSSSTLISTNEKVNRVNVVTNGETVKNAKSTNHRQSYNDQQQNIQKVVVSPIQKDRSYSMNHLNYISSDRPAGRSESFSLSRPSAVSVSNIVTIPCDTADTNTTSEKKIVYKIPQVSALRKTFESGNTDKVGKKSRIPNGLSPSGKPKILTVNGTANHQENVKKNNAVESKQSFKSSVDMKPQIKSTENNKKTVHFEQNRTVQNNRTNINQTQALGSALKQPNTNSSAQETASEKPRSNSFVKDNCFTLSDKAKSKPASVTVMKSKEPEQDLGVAKVKDDSIPVTSIDDVVIEDSTDGKPIDNNRNASPSQRLNINTVQSKSCDAAASIGNEDKVATVTAGDSLLGTANSGAGTGVNKDQEDVVKARVHLKTWNPVKLLETIYSVRLMDETVEDLSHSFIAMEGVMEKLPMGKRKSTLLKTWKRRYFKATDGWLHYYENNNFDKPSHSIQLMGGTVEALDSRILGVDDGRGHYLMVRCQSGTDFENWRVALESQTADNARAVYVRPVLHSPPHPNKRVVIIDIGSTSVRAGVLGEQACLPQLFFPTVVAQKKGSGECVVGFDAYRPEVREQSSLRFPVRPSIKVDKGRNQPFNIDMELLPHVFEKIFKDLKVDCRSHWVLLSTPQMLADKLKGEIMHCLTRRFGVAGVCIAPQSLLAMYSYKATSGIIVDVGERIEILPISDGYIVDGGVTRQPFGGEKVADSLNQYLTRRYYHFFTEVERLIVRHVMEETCYVAADYNEECRQYTQDPHSFLSKVYLNNYDLPAGTYSEVTHDESCFKSAEGLFNTDLWGMDYPKLHKLVHKAIMECPMDNRREMCRSIYLSGGLTMLPRFAERLQAEITKLVPAGLTIQVHASPHRYHAAFIGGCTLAAQEQFEQTCISREQWNKNGTKELKKWHMPS